MTTRDRRTVTGLLIAATALAVGLASAGRATWVEAFAFVTGALCVWLTVRESIWNFPVSLLNVAAYFEVYARSRLFADAGLQVVYFVLGVMGWWMWLRCGQDAAPLRVDRCGPLELIASAAFIAAATVGLWQLLHRVGGSASFWDALTTSISLVAQWLLNRKRLENWVAWIVVDIIYVPLYLYKELYLTAVLYAIFLAMAVMGLRAWYLDWRKRETTPSAVTQAVT